MSPTFGQSAGRGSLDLSALREAYERAQASFLAARRAYLVLQAAHQRGRFHDREGEDFLHLVEAFRAEAGEVHSQVEIVRGREGRPSPP